MRVTVRERRLPSGKVQIYHDLYFGQGRRRIKAFGILPQDRDARREMRDAANAVAAKMQLKDTADAYGIQLESGREASFSAYLETLTSTTDEINTRRAWEFAGNALASFGGHDLTFGQVDREFLERFSKHLVREYANSTAGLVLAKIKTALRKAVTEGVVQSMPGSVSIKKTSRHPVFLTIEEVRTLDQTECTNPNVKNAFLFCCFTGLRWSDVSSLTWDQVKDGHLTFRQEKTGEVMRLPLSATALQILDRQRGAVPSSRTKSDQKPGRIFLLPTREGARALLKSWAEYAEIDKKVVWHTSRHTFGVMNISAGNDLFVTSRLMGHKSLRSTELYAQVVDKKKKEAMDNLPSL